MKLGDEILRVNERPILTIDDFYEVLKIIKNSLAITLVLKRNSSASPLLSRLKRAPITEQIQSINLTSKNGNKPYARANYEMQRLITQLSSDADTELTENHHSDLCTNLTSDARTKSSPNIFINIKPTDVCVIQRQVSVLDILNTLDETSSTNLLENIKTNNFVNTVAELTEVTNLDNSPGDFNIKPTAVYSEVLKRKAAKPIKNRSVSIVERRHELKPGKGQLVQENEDRVNNNSKPGISYRHSSPNVIYNFKRNELNPNTKLQDSTKRPSFIRKKMDKRQIHDGSKYVAEELPLYESIELLNIETESVIPETPIKSIEVLDFVCEEKLLVTEQVVSTPVESIELVTFVSVENSEMSKQVASTPVEILDFVFEEEVTEKHREEEEDIYDNYEPVSGSEFRSLEYTKEGFVVININKQPDWPPRLGK